MIQIDVTEQCAAELNELALQDSRSVDDLIKEAIDTYVSFRYTEAELTPAQLDRLQHSLAQAKSGELIPQEQVEVFFDNWEREIASK